MELIPLNNSPNLTMEQITKLLLNNKFMSDVQFDVDGKVIYAHSWELMKRSVKFREQFQTNLGQNKLIPIEGVMYETFYQFIRFIYTDECDITEETVCQILKLAVQYKIVTLETKVLNTMKNISVDFNLYEFGLLNKYELYNNNALNHILEYGPKDKTDIMFLNIQPIVLEKILESDYAYCEWTEVELFDGLVCWMNKLCENNEILLAQRRSHFDKFIRLIRFPAMSADNLYQCVKIDPNLLANDDISTIIKHNVLGLIGENNNWIEKPLRNYGKPWTKQIFSSVTKWDTKFTVLDNLILQGVQYGLVENAEEFFALNYEIRITSRDCATNVTNTVNLEFQDEINEIISLGESIKLVPNFDYLIEIIFCCNEDVYDEKQNYFINCRQPNVVPIVTGPKNLVMLSQASDNLFEIFFKEPTD